MSQLITLVALAVVCACLPLLLVRRWRATVGRVLLVGLLILGAGIAWGRSRPELTRRQENGVIYRALRGTIGRASAHRMLGLHRLAPQHSPEATEPAPDTPDVVVYRLDLKSVPEELREEAVRMRTQLLFPADITVLLGMSDAEQLWLRARLPGDPEVSRVGFATVIDRSGEYTIDAGAAEPSALGPVQVFSFTHRDSGEQSELALLQLDGAPEPARWTEALPVLLPEGRRRVLWVPHIADALPTDVPASVQELAALPHARGFRFEGTDDCGVHLHASLQLPSYPEKDPALMPARDWIVGREHTFWSSTGLYDAQNIFCRSSARAVPTMPHIVMFVQ